MIEFKSRYFVLPAIALTVLAIPHAPADGGCAARLRPVRCRSGHQRFVRSIPAHTIASRRQGLRAGRQ